MGGRKERQKEGLFARRKIEEDKKERIKEGKLDVKMKDNKEENKKGKLR